LKFTQRQIDLLEMRLTEMDLVDGLEISGQENRTNGHQIPSLPLSSPLTGTVGISRFESESDSDDDPDEEEDGRHLFGRHSSGGYELVGKENQSETTSEGGGYFPSASSLNDGFMKSKASFVEVMTGEEPLTSLCSSLGLLDGQDYGRRIQASSTYDY
jgi:hypothetical protein